MTATVINSHGLTLHDVSTQTKTKTIVGSMKAVLRTNSYIKNNPGNAYCRNGMEMHRIYFSFDREESVDILMKRRSSWCPRTEQWRVIRTLPKHIPFYDRCVTGLKIQIDQSTTTEKLNELDLRHPFDGFGRILRCQWMNEDQTEALFTFADYDSVDQIILASTSLKIKGNRINLEKAPTANDMTTHERSYMIHVTNLPLRVTSDEVSSIFRIPIARILLYPCYRLEQTRVIGGRSSSEAWIKRFPDEKTARILAQERNRTLVHKNRIQCEAMPETINEEELCEKFQTGQCSYTFDACHYKHFSCSLTDTCDDEYCWLGHSDKRKTVSIKRPQFRSENARYRLRFSNLPPNVTQEELIVRLNIPRKYAHYFILQTNEDNSKSPQMAYFIRQRLENQLRQMIDRYHGTSYSSILTQPIQCQLEVNQDFYEPNDANEVIQSASNSAYASPALSTHSACPNRINRALYHSSAISTKSWKPNPVKHLYTSKPVLTEQSTLPKQKPTTNSFKSKAVPTIRSPPADFSNLSGRSCWSKEMIANDSIDSDEYYWMENEPNKEKNVLTKIYTPKTDRSARVRALRERVALERLAGLSSVPKLLQSNFDVSYDHSSKKELWTIMKFINGERLSDYIKYNKIDFREALQITQQLLKIIKEIHSKHVIHRDIQPKSILIQQRPNDQSMNFMFINFGSACTNNFQWKASLGDMDEYLGNQFYRMPQFEQRSAQTKLFEQSPTIDTTGICAILFWILTGHEPKESKDIWQKSPHYLRDHPRIIQTRIDQLTAFRRETGINEHLYRHLMLVFDRAFANPEQQWPVNELDYQLQLLTTLIDSDRLSLNQNMNDQISSPSIPLGDPFVYLVSLIHHLKDRFVHRDSQYVCCSTNENSHWSSQDGTIEHKHSLSYHNQGKDLSIDIHWHIEILKDQDFDISIQAKDKKNINIQLPMGRYKIDEQINPFHVYFTNFQVEIKTLIHVLLQSIG